MAERAQSADTTPWEPSRSDGLGGLCVFFGLFVFALVVSNWMRTFYQDDNVVELAPLIIDASRQVMEGRIPFFTWYVGGGGGSPILYNLQTGVLNPFTMIPAILFRGDAPLMINAIVSLHLGLFAAGGWFLARALNAPPWAAAVSGLSLGFSGYCWIHGATWMHLVIPFAFLPWLLLGIRGLAHATTLRGVVLWEIVTAASVYCLFWSGAPSPALYSAIVTLFFVGALVAHQPQTFRRLALRLVPQAIFFLVAIAPLLWHAWQVFAYYGRTPDPVIDYSTYCVPGQGYLGLLFPASYALWTFPFVPLTSLILTNVLVSAGIVPAWYILVQTCRYPSLIKDRRIAIYLGGLLLFVVVLSPPLFGLGTILCDVPVFNAFRFPYRALPAFHVLLITLFAVVVARREIPHRSTVQALLVLVCIAGSVAALAYEYKLSQEQGTVRSWARIAPRFGQTSQWDEQTLDRLRRSGYVLSVCRRKPYFARFRYYFHGNLGAQYKVHTVGNYILWPPGPAGKEAGINYRGRVVIWPRARQLVVRSSPEPLHGPITWDNGIGPKNLEEFARKTYIGAAIVEKQWKEPMEFFTNSPDWHPMTEKHGSVIFQRSRKR